MSNTENVLTKKDLTKTLWRYIFTRQAPFNYETMQSGGWVWSIHPAMKKIYGDDKVLSEKYKDHFKFYNTHPWLGNLILAACLAIESTKDKDATHAAIELRTALMGPLAGLGDAIIWIMLMTIMGAIAAYQALAGSIMGWVFAEAVQLVIWITFFKLFYVAYEKGLSFVTDKSDQFKNITEAASIIGITVVGALVASTVNVNIALTPTIGEVQQSLNDLLNMIVPKFGNIVAVAIMYWGLGKKNMSSGKMVLIVIVAAVILGGLGILG